MPLTPSLPNETLFQIFEHATSPSNLGAESRVLATALALSLTSKRFRDLAEPLMYLDISLVNDSNARRLLANVAFGRHPTRKFSIQGAFFRAEGVDKDTARALIMRAGMTGLEYLELSYFPSLDSGMLQVAGSALRSLSLNRIDAVEEIPPDPVTFNFQLRHLELGTICPPASFLSSIFTTSVSTFQESEDSGSVDFSRPSVELIWTKIMHLKTLENLQVLTWENSADAAATLTRDEEIEKLKAGRDVRIEWEEEPEQSKVELEGELYKPATGAASGDWSNGDADPDEGTEEDDDWDESDKSDSDFNELGDEE
ncbi:hypothetical protein P7C70_g8688, partial [Phenoliferia sp. Uapishka_3]